MSSESSSVVAASELLKSSDSFGTANSFNVSDKYVGSLFGQPSQT
jgi:hypothetical protein